MIDKEALLRARFGEEEVEIPGVGAVRVRPLTRAEALRVRGEELDVAVMEQRLIAAALVEPKLTEAEVAQWQESAPAGELEPVINAIVRLSGLTVEAPKEAMRTFRD